MWLLQSTCVETAGPWWSPFPPLTLGLLCVHGCYVASFVSDSLQTLWTAPCQAPMSMGFCYFLFHFIVKLRDCVKADGARRWIVYCPWLQEAEILCNLPCNISQATVKLQLYIIDTNLSWWMHSFLAASRALIINFIFIIKGFL